MTAKEFAAEMHNAGATRIHCRTCRFIGEQYHTFGNMCVCIEFAHVTVFIPLNFSMFSGKY